MTSNPSSTIHALDLDDLDHVVGGAGAPSHAPPENQHDAFMASLAGVNAVAATNATAVASGHETAAAAITAVETAAQTAHVSTDAALTQLLTSTHGNVQVATELSTRLVSGAAANEIVQLVHAGNMSISNVNDVVNPAIAALASFSADGQSALGMSKNAALDVIDAKISLAAHASGQLHVESLQSQGSIPDDWNQTIVTQSASPIVETSGSTHSPSPANSSNPAPTGTQSYDQIAKAFDAAETSHLSGARDIEFGVRDSLDQQLLVAASNPLAAQTSTMAGEAASILEAFKGMPAGLMSTIVGSSDVMAKLIPLISGDGAHSISDLTVAAQQAGVSVDLTLAIAARMTTQEDVAKGISTELQARIHDGAFAADMTGVGDTAISAIVRVVAGEAGMTPADTEKFTHSYRMS